MRTKVYSFKPKGKGYNVFVTKTYHGNSTRLNRTRSSHSMTDAVIDLTVKSLVRGIFDRKK